MEESRYPGAPVIAPVGRGPNVSPVLRALSPGRGRGRPGGSSPSRDWRSGARTATSGPLMPDL